MPLQERFKRVAQGAMVLTGNTLNIQKNAILSTLDWENGSYTSTNTSLVAATGFPAGTTFNPANSSSSAILNVPANSIILYAQLWWTIGPDPGTSRNNSVTFTTPNNTYTISSTISDSAGSGAGIVYYRGADVKSIIQSSGGGTYTFGNIPGETLSDNTGKYSAAAWYLIVVYENYNMPYRYFNVNTGIASVSSGAPSSFTFSNIATPTTGSVSGYLLISETYGDMVDGAAVYVGASSPGVAIGNTSTTIWNGNAPYAKSTNMFPANILIADTNDANIGLLDTRGTFGNNNKNPFAGTSPAFARINADIAGFNISNRLSNNQTSLFTQVAYGGSGNGYITSQSVQVDLNAPSIRNFVAICNKEYAVIGDELTYTLIFGNTGQIAANDVFIVNTIPTGLSFVPGSVTIDGISNSSANLGIPGINLGNINISTTKTVTFKAIVNSVPSANPISNTSNITFNFQLSANNTVYSSVISQAAITTVNYVNLSTIQSTNKNYYQVGEEITYTFKLNNTGNVQANNVVFLNTIPSSALFVVNSLSVNGVTQTGFNPGASFTISTIPVGVTTVTYKALVLTIPSSNVIVNTPSAITYNYLTNSNTYYGGVNSNSSTVNINQVYLNANKIANKYDYVGDTLNYTIALTNTGNTSANNVTIYDTIPSNTTFVANSLKVNNLTQIGANPNAGYNIGTVPVGTTTVTFNVTINTIPSPNIITNSAKINYSYTVDPSTPNGITNNINTNITTTTINHVFLNATKITNKNYSYVGDIISYSLRLINTGNASANNVVIYDTIPTNTVFVTNSLKVDGVTQTGGNPNGGYNIGTVPVGTTTVTFDVTVTTIPTPVNNISNSARIGYVFTKDPSVPNGVVNNNINTNVSVTTINHVFLNASKSINKNYSYVGDTIIYIVRLVNTGNISANNVTIYDTTPTDTTFVTDSLKVNGISQTGANINLGYNITTVPIGVTTVTFNVVVNTIPTLNRVENSARINYSYTVDPSVTNTEIRNINTNVATTTINQVFLNSSITTDKQDIFRNETITYTIELNNTGNTTANNIALLNPIPNNTIFVTDSLRLNGITIPNVISTNSFNIGTIPVGISTITYKVTLVTVPNTNVITNSANINYNFTVDPSVPSSQSGSSSSNLVNIASNEAVVVFAQEVDKNFAVINDTLTYTMSMMNIGNKLASNVIINDIVGERLEFLDNSINVNGVFTTETLGRIQVGIIGIGNRATVTFQAKIKP